MSPLPRLGPSTKITVSNSPPGRGIISGKGLRNWMSTYLCAVHEVTLAFISVTVKKHITFLTGRHGS